MLVSAKGMAKRMIRDPIGPFSMSMLFFLRPLVADVLMFGKVLSRSYCALRECFLIVQIVWHPKGALRIVLS